MEHFNIVFTHLSFPALWM